MVTLLSACIGSFWFNLVLFYCPFIISLHWINLVEFGFLLWFLYYQPALEPSGLIWFFDGLLIISLLWILLVQFRIVLWSLYGQPALDLSGVIKYCFMVSLFSACIGFFWFNLFCFMLSLLSAFIGSFWFNLVLFYDFFIISLHWIILV
jgi:hypothetical protein